METIYSHNVDKELISKVVASLNAGKSVKVVNTHETFYGWGYDRHLKEALKDQDCKIECIEHDHIEGFPSVFIVSPSK